MNVFQIPGLTRSRSHSGSKLAALQTLRVLVALVWLGGAWPAFSQGSPIYAWTNFVGQPGGQGNVDGTGCAARFFSPSNVAVDSAGNVYLADHLNCTIRKVTPAGVVTTLAGGAGACGTNDGTGSAARFNQPAGVTVDRGGNVFVADQQNHTIRKMTPDGVVTTLAGCAGASGTNDGLGSAARFRFPHGVAVDNGGNVFVADSGNWTIRKVTAAGVVTTLACRVRTSGTNDGTGSAGDFCPEGVAVDSAGNVFVAGGCSSSTIWKVTPAGVVSALAGSGGRGSEDGAGNAARFFAPLGVAVDSGGNVFVADSWNYTIRKVTPAGVVATLAGSAENSGSADGTGSTARFEFPAGVAVDSTGNVFVADFGSSTIRKVTPAGVVTTLAGSAGTSGANDDMGCAARFQWPKGVAVDSAGSVFVADYSNNTIRKVTPAGAVTTVAGSAGQTGSADGTGSGARFYYPQSVVVDSAGNLLVADSHNSTIRKVTPAGAVTTLAGSAGNRGSADGAGSAARFDHPSAVALDGAGNLFVADTWNHTIRKVTRAGVVTTLAGSAGQNGSADGVGSAARFHHPEGVTVDRAGNAFVADTENHTIRKVTPAGVVTTLAGGAGQAGGADGTGNAARFREPQGVAVDSAGNVFVADRGNSTIRKVTAAGVVTTIGGVAGVVGGGDGLGTSARFSCPYGIAVDRAGNLYVADTENNRITRGTPVHR